MDLDLKVKLKFSTRTDIEMHGLSLKFPIHVSNSTRHYMSGPTQIDTRLAMSHNIFFFRKMPRLPCTFSTFCNCLDHTHCVVVIDEVVTYVSFYIKTIGFIYDPREETRRLDQRLRIKKYLTTSTS